MSKAFLLALVALTCSACRQDMQDQPKYKPMALSHFFADGRTARPVPANTIAVNETDDDPAASTGMSGGAFLTTFPMPVTKELIERGQERFNIDCTPCHSPIGDGHGMVALRGFKIPADLSSDRVRNAPPGYLYAVITNGYGAMPDYTYQIPQVRDRWAVVAYIRALELSRRATLDDVPPQERRKLEAGQ